MKTPHHVAIIMDGNGRWASARGLPRGKGHQKGAETAIEIVRQVFGLGIQQLTLFGFSTENWARPESEIETIFSVVEKSLTRLKHETPKLRLKVIGDRERLPGSLRSLIEQLESVDGHEPLLCIALNYGARWEIARVAKEAQRLGVEPTEENMARLFRSSSGPDPDLIIRTGGEQRLSNFLLWQAAYAELVFSSTLWPDFKAAELEKILSVFASRERRFGGIASKLGFG